MYRPRRRGAGLAAQATGTAVVRVGCAGATGARPPRESRLRQTSNAVRKRFERPPPPKRPPPKLGPASMLFMHSANACRRLCAVAPTLAAAAAAASGLALWLEWPIVDSATTAPTTASPGRIVPNTSFAADGALSGFGGGVGHQPGSEKRSAKASYGQRPGRGSCCS